MQLPTEPTHQLSSETEVVKSRMQGSPRCSSLSAGAEIWSHGTWMAPGWQCWKLLSLLGCLSGILLRLLGKNAAHEHIEMQSRQTLL